MIDHSNILERDEKEIDNNILNLRIADFIKRYAPQDDRYSNSFHVELHQLVRAIYSEASKEPLAVMKNLIAVYPFPPLRTKTESEES